jgi:hypothetical protein
VPLPLSRRAQCLACEAELHVCRLCQFYDPRVKEQCTEDRAEEVREKELANFCDYFKPKPEAYVRRDDSRAQTAKAKLDGFFDSAHAQAEGPAPAAPARDRLEQLFGPSKGRK